MLKKIADFLTLKKNIAAILTAAILLEMGERIGERFLPIYIMALGGSAIVIGLLNAMDNLLGALYSVPGGYLSDRIGYKKSLILFNVFASVGYLLIILFPYWQTALAGAVLFISWSSTSMPAIMSAISKILPFHKRTMGVSMHSISRRVPKALGPVIGGFCIGAWGEISGVRIAFSIAFILSIISMFAQKYLIDEPSAKKSRQTFAFSRIFTLINPRLKRLLIADILVRFCEQIPYAFVVIWCMKHLKISAVQFGFLSAIEMVTAMLVYVPVAYLVEKSKTKKKFVTTTFIFFSLFPLSLLFFESFWGLVLSFVIRGLKEFGEPTRKAMILDLSSEEQRAMTYGTYYFLRDVIVACAAFGGGIIWGIAPRMNFIIAFIFGVVSVLYFARYVEEAKIEEKPAANAPS